MRIAFYAPLKAPHHPVPSGDRQMARGLIAALRAAGHRVDLLSSTRSYLPAPHPMEIQRRSSAATAEVDAIAACWTDSGQRPDLLFTYHLYYKAPDLLGPPLATRFGLPYVTAEASHANKRAAGPWSEGHREVERAVRDASINLCFTPNDRAGLAGLVPACRLADLPPFIDTGPFGPRARRAPGPVRLITVAMMRPGDKQDSYAFLARSLARLDGLDWRLRIVGDGPARSAIEQDFADLPSGRLDWCGVLGPDEVARLLQEADMFVWPGFNEAFGLSYLEAQACGLPVVAIAGAGTPSVIRHEQTGLLTAATLDAYGTALERLIRDPSLRSRLGANASRFVHDDRGLSAAAVRLDDALALALRLGPPALTRLDA